jgi:hypothetical protein
MNPRSTYVRPFEGGELARSQIEVDGERVQPPASASKQ